MKVFQEGWEDVSLSEYLDIERIKKENKGYVSRSLELLCYLTDSDEWENMPSKDVIQEYLRNEWLNHPPITNMINQEVGKYTLKPFTKLSLSEWIDVDSAIMESDLSKICAIVYKQSKIDEWGNIVYEPYEYSATERSKEFLDSPVTEVIGVWNGIIKYRENLLNVFAELFDGYEEELTEEDREMLSPSEIREIENSIKKDNQKKDFAWQKLLDTISGGVWSHIPDILELPHTFVFNMRLAQKVYGD